MTKFKILTGPFEGLIVEEGGGWLIEQGASSLSQSDADLENHFKEWAQAHQQPFSEEGWETWLNSWESQEI